MYKLKFANLVPLFSGTPYCSASVMLSGDYIPKLTQYSFQDKGCVNKAKNAVVLIQWAIESGSPGFIPWLISESNLAVMKAERFEGYCDDVRFIENDKKVEIVYNLDGKQLTKRMKVG